jgi:hypothetical protein
LLEAPAEDRGESAPKGPERAAPFRPDVELEFGRAFVERDHATIDLCGTTHWAAETGEVLDQPPARPIFHELKVHLVRETTKECGANHIHIANRAFEPGIVAQGDALTRKLDPALRDPIAQSSAPTAQMRYPKLETARVLHQSVYALNGSNVPLSHLLQLPLRLWPSWLLATGRV